jgi:dihydroorotate dehydrogenase (NAD+) catalytic subunit
MSGPAIKPVAVRMVYEASHAVKIPVIGMGGISNYEDAVEFIMAGATAIAVGAANFHNPYATVEIVEGIERYMTEQGIEDLGEIRGIV